MTASSEHTRLSRVDMHCHSTASEVSRLGVQRAVGLPECATPPEEVYELAKRRGMDFVTITDHDTIAGALEIADRPDVFVSEELTAWFRGERQAVHVLCYDIAAADHEWLQAHSGDVEECAGYLDERGIVCALAHPYYTVGAPLSARHRRRLAELFDIWEVRNGSRARELNRPAAVYVATNDGIGIGGSDDHAGVDIGRTFSETPAARTPAEFLAHLRAGRVRGRGEQGSAAKWAHAAIALAARTFAGEAPGQRPGGPDPRVVMTMMQRLLREGDAREGATGRDLTPDDARRLLRAWLAAVELDGLDERGLIAYMQDEGFSHADLYRRACRAHERRLRTAVGQVLGAIAATGATADTADTSATAATGTTTVAGAAASVFEACIAAIPYAPAAAFLSSEKAKLDSREGETRRVAILADGIGSTHGVTRTIEEIRERGVRGFEIEVIGTDADVDRRLPAVAEIEVPFYAGLKIGVPSLTVAVEALAEGRFDAIHVCSPGPVGAAGALVARALRLPLVGSYHTELTAYAALRAQDARVADAMDVAVRSLYRACDLVLSPSPASDEALRELGVRRELIARWDRGVDTTRFDPALRGSDAALSNSDPALRDSDPALRDSDPALRDSDPALRDSDAALRDSDAARPDDAINVLYAGRMTREKGSELLADAFVAARRQEPRLRLLLAGDGPELEGLRKRVGEHATHLGWLEGEALARAYASADIFLFASSTDTFGQVILEAQASGVPVVAVARGGPCSLMEDRVSGLLCEPDAQELAARVVELAGSPLLRKRLATAGLAAARERTWESALGHLADGYGRVLAAGDRGSDEHGERRAA